MVGIFHGYVSHNQMVYVISNIWSSRSGFISENFHILSAAFDGFCLSVLVKDAEKKVGHPAINSSHDDGWNLPHKKHGDLGTVKFGFTTLLDDFYDSLIIPYLLFYLII